MYRVPVFLSLVFASFAFAEPDAPVATLDKTGIFHGVGSVVDPREEPGSNGDIQNVRWDLHEGYERLVFDLHENAYGVKKTPPLKTPGSYRITNETYPCRLVCDLNGRQANGISPPPDFSKSRLIKVLYRIVVLDDATVKFALELREPIEVEVFELHDPARIVLDIRPAADNAKRYSVRTRAMKRGEQAGNLEEELFSKGFRNVRILRCTDGNFCLEAGLFLNREDATALAGKIATAGIPVFVEERGINDFPKAP